MGLGHPRAGQARAPPSERSGMARRGGGRYVAQRFWRAGDAGVRYLLDKATLGPQQPEQLSRADTAIKKSSNPIQSLIRIRCIVLL